ncbi:MAG: hypothetical protein E7578_00320 [Ruminococcaceae bacterium]|nr:hypothetical protein [Oscillospiraceae bacterium]
MKSSSINKVIVSVITFVLIINSFGIEVYSNADKLSETQSSIRESTSVHKNPTDNSCPHSLTYNFDDQNMTVPIYKGNTVDFMINDILSSSGDLARVFYGDNEVFEGEFKDGMIVKIYHGDTLYGEYNVGNLLEPYPTLPNNANPLSRTIINSSAYGFILPIDNMNLTSNISRGLGSAYGGTQTENKRNPGTYSSRITVSDITGDWRDDIVVIWRNTSGMENIIVCHHRVELRVPWPVIFG